MMIALGISALGQAQKSTPDDTPRAKRSSGKTEQKPADGENTPLILTGTSLEAQLQSVIDVRKSSVGDEVVLKTTKAIKQNGETVVPKGANLIGRITEVKRKTKDNATSKIGMVFDRIQGKNLDIPVNASIVSVVTASANAAAGDLFSTDVAGSGSAGGSASAGRASGGSGGGLLGGVAPTVGGLLNTTTSAVGNVAGTATSTAASTLGNTTSTVGRTVNGLQISNSASGSASSSSSLSAQGKDVRVEKGATFRLMLDGSGQVQE
jgi:hypothetical protein